MKRARTALAGTPGPETSSNSGTTDWAKVGDGPASLFADLVLAKDVADYVRFRAVCRPWRRCSLDPRLQCCLDGRYHPRQWIMLDKALSSPRRRFLNVSSGECIRMDLPALEEHTLLSLTPEGLLLLFDEATLAVRLLNPLTQQVAELPPLTELLTTDLQIARRFGRRLGEIISVYGVGVVSEASAVAVNLYSSMALVVAKPGDERWTLVGNGSFRSPLTFAGRFYCATTSGIMVLDVSSNQQPSLLTAVDWSRSQSLCFSAMAALYQGIDDFRRSLHFSATAVSLYLVDNGEDLMLVHRMSRRLDDDDGHERKYNVYKVDLDAGVLIPAKSFGGRAVFMGLWGRTLSVSGNAFTHIAADTLYSGSDCDGISWEQNANRYLGSERMEPPNIVECLSYCICGTGKELA